MPIIQMLDYDHKVLMTLGEMREKGIVFPCFNTICREMPELGIARLSDSIQKLKWKGFLSIDDRQHRLTEAGLEEYRNFKNTHNKQ